MTHDPLSLTCKLLAFNTINPPGNERECARFLGGLFEGAGLDVRYFEFAHQRAYACRAISNPVRDSFSYSVYLVAADHFTPDKYVNGVTYGQSNRVV